MTGRMYMCRGPGWSIERWDWVTWTTQGLVCPWRSIGWRSRRDRSHWGRMSEAFQTGVENGTYDLKEPPGQPLLVLVHLPPGHGFSTQHLTSAASGKRASDWSVWKGTKWDCFFSLSSLIGAGTYHSGRTLRRRYGRIL